MTAQEILRMIETVDPGDGAKLDEIDARVWCYVRNKIYDKMAKGFYDETTFYSHDEHSGGPRRIEVKYTRSRDALKNIRPDGWVFNFCEHADKTWYCVADQLTDRGLSGGVELLSPYLTEELAELHAVIQAIEYERNQQPGESK